MIVKKYIYGANCTRLYKYFNYKIGMFGKKWIDIGGTRHFY